MSLARDARCWLRAHQYGLLSTHTLAVKGYPFGSVAPYMLDHDAYPVMLVSRLAEHTKNITVDPRVSLLVLEAGDDVQANARVTLIGIAERIEHPEFIEPRYARYFPTTKGYRTELDFEFWRIAPVTLRAIASFAKAHWLSREAYAPPANTIAEHEDGVLAHMNTDHAHALQDFCKHRFHIQPERVEMIGIDCDGFDVRADDRILRFEFDAPVTDAGAARAALVEMAQQARTV